MKNYTEIIKIIDGGLKNDTKKVYDYSLLLAEKLRNSGEISKAERIFKLLGQQSSHITNDSITATSSQSTPKLKQIPFDQDSKMEIADLFTPEQIDSKKLFLNHENQQQLDEFIKAYTYSDKLVSQGLEVATSLLLFGPPGCGKTQTALYIAQALSLPIIIARLDTLISSYLGNTSKNIRLLFEYSSKIPCILFLDEFDAVAKLRDDQHEMGELKRVVNSLLQNIDSLGDKCILIAATNHEKLLDEAIWRRFSTRLKIDLPSFSIIKDFLGYHFDELKLKLDRKYIDLLADLFVGQSMADIEQITKRGVRRAIIDDRQVEVADMVDSYFLYVQIGMGNADLDVLRIRKVEYLIKKLNKPSKRTLGELLRCHHNTISSYLEKIEQEKVR